MKTKVQAVWCPIAASDVIVSLKSLLNDMLLSLNARMSNTPIPCVTRILVPGKPCVMQKRFICTTGYLIAKWIK